VVFFNKLQKRKSSADDGCAVGREKEKSLFLLHLCGGDSIG